MAYYFDHQAEIDQEIEAELEEAEQAQSSRKLSPVFESASRLRGSTLDGSCYSIRCDDPRSHMRSPTSYAGAGSMMVTAIEDSAATLLPDDELSCSIPDSPAR